MLLSLEAREVAHRRASRAVIELSHALLSICLFDVGLRAFPRSKIDAASRVLGALHFLIFIMILFTRA